jgi:hypothetical protein
MILGTNKKYFKDNDKVIKVLVGVAEEKLLDLCPSALCSVWVLAHVDKETSSFSRAMKTLTCLNLYLSGLFQENHVFFCFLLVVCSQYINLCDICIYKVCLVNEYLLLNILLSLYADHARNYFCHMTCRTAFDQPLELFFCAVQNLAWMI